MKELLCIQGKEMLYDYCLKNNVPHRKCGKLVVAQQEDALEGLLSNARRAGVDAKMLTSRQASSLEPEVRCAAALESPTTGIIDSHSFLSSLLSEAESAGAVLALRTKVLELQNKKVFTDQGTIDCEIVVNAAGLSAADFAGVTTHRFAKGNYFGCKRKPFKRLVYPLPEPGGLGIHATVTLDGSNRFGPDVEYLDEKSDFDYKVSEARKAAFCDAIRSYWPTVREDDLYPDYSGIRPKVEEEDFSIYKKDGVVHLLGIESPGLTASLAIADYATKILEE